MFNKLENFKKFKKLSKDFGELDDNLIIQHFHHIHIHTLTYMMMYSSNFSTFKNTTIHNTYLFHSYKNSECSCKNLEGK